MMHQNEVMKHRVKKNKFHDARYAKNKKFKRGGGGGGGSPSKFKNKKPHPPGFEPMRKVRLRGRITTICTLSQNGYGTSLTAQTAGIKFCVISGGDVSVPLLQTLYK